MDQAHQAAVADLSRIIGDFYKREQPFRVFHGSTNSTRVQTYKRSETVDVSLLNRIISIDKETLTAIVEPNVSMDQLVRETLKYGLVPPVVMEFKSITVGGGIQGGAGESSSFKWGCFNEICNWYQLILGDGSVVTTSPTERSDLFYGTAGSYGSLGVLTAIEIQLVPATKYVAVSYKRVTSFADATKQLAALSADQSHDYIDGILYAPNRGVVITGKLTNKASYTKQRFSRGRDDWMYTHADKLSSLGQDTSETVPLYDYLFRYDRGAFWTGHFTFERSGIPFNRFSRWLLNPMLNAKKLYQGLQATNAAQQYFVQDMAVPQHQATKFLTFIDQTFGSYPLWLCPLKTEKNVVLLSSHLNTDLVINVGVWLRERHVDANEFVALNRTVEQQLHELGGKKWLYAQAYYSEQEFWAMYDKPSYDKLRRKYKATTLPTVYQKIASKPLPIQSTKKAALKTLFGMANLRIKN
jgi:delta24-sterol reductase